MISAFDALACPRLTLDAAPSRLSFRSHCGPAWDVSCACNRAQKLPDRDGFGRFDGKHVRRTGLKLLTHLADRQKTHDATHKEDPCRAFATGRASASRWRVRGARPPHGGRRLA